MIKITANPVGGRAAGLGISSSVGTSDGPENAAKAAAAQAEMPHNGPRLVKNGFCAIPIKPGTKGPGEFVRGRWEFMDKWSTRYLEALPSEGAVTVWTGQPGNPGVGVILGKASKGLIGIDIDTYDAEIIKAITNALPQTPFRKTVWRETRPAAGTIVETYLANRELALLPLRCLGFHPDCPHPSGRRYPAMVALVEHSERGPLASTGPICGLTVRARRPSRQQRRASVRSQEAPCNWRASSSVAGCW